MSNAHKCYRCTKPAVFGMGDTWFCREHRPPGFLPGERHLWAPRKDGPSYCVRCEVERTDEALTRNCPGHAAEAA